MFGRVQVTLGLRRVDAEREQEEQRSDRHEDDRQRERTPVCVGRHPCSDERHRTDHRERDLVSINRREGHYVPAVPVSLP